MRRGKERGQTKRSESGSPGGINDQAQFFPGSPEKAQLSRTRCEPSSRRREIVTKKLKNEGKIHWVVSEYAKLG